MNLFSIGCFLEALPCFLYITCLNWQRVIDSQLAEQVKPTYSLPENSLVPSDESSHVDAVDQLALLIDDTTPEAAVVQPETSQKVRHNYGKYF